MLEIARSQYVVSDVSMSYPSWGDGVRLRLRPRPRNRFHTLALKRDTDRPATHFTFHNVIQDQPQCEDKQFLFFRHYVEVDTGCVVAPKPIKSEPSFDHADSLAPIGVPNVMVPSEDEAPASLHMRCSIAQTLGFDADPTILTPGRPDDIVRGKDESSPDQV